MCLLIVRVVLPSRAARQRMAAVIPPSRGFLRADHLSALSVILYCSVAPGWQRALAMADDGDGSFGGGGGGGGVGQGALGERGVLRQSVSLVTFYDRRARS